MTIISDDALEFAKTHIQRFYDSDFYPKPEEFNAIWYSWEEVKQYLSNKNVVKLPSVPPKCMAWKKHRSGYRVVHQLNPVDTIIYTALVYQISESIEARRVPVDKNIACAYRIQLDEGSFFSSGSGFDSFRTESVELAKDFPYVLTVDVNDYYNQISHHRINNSIEHASPDDKGIAEDIEKFLSKVNSKTSQGIPVGPAASIILAEGIMIDVDQFLINFDNVEHTRYVDDFRIFGSSYSVLNDVLEKLTIYLYENHRLSINWEKTKIQNSEEFVQTNINNPYELAKIEVFKNLPVMGDYASTEDLNEAEPDYMVAFEALMEAKDTILDSIDDMLDRKSMDLGFTRALIRQARYLKEQRVAQRVLDNIDFFEPVINNAIMLLDSITDKVFVYQNRERMLGVLTRFPYLTELTRIWFEWYWTKYTELLQIPEIDKHIRSTNHVYMQSRAAVIKGDISWIRGLKNSYFQHSPTDRISILLAASLLPTDEKNNWLRTVIESTSVELEKWVAKYVIECNKRNIFQRDLELSGYDSYEDDIPF